MERGHLQAQAQAAHFHGGARSRPGSHDCEGAGHDNQIPAAVVPHVVDKYNPNHPDADWGGFVQRSCKKRFYADQSAAKDNLTYDEKGGIMPDATVTAMASSGKKLFEPQQVPTEQAVPGVPFQSAVYQVGPGGNVSSNDWKTSYASQTSMEATPSDTFTLGTRQNSQHKRHVSPMYEQPRGTQQSLERVGSPASSSLGGSGSNGSSSSRRVDSRRSLLAGIGKLVAAEDLSSKLSPPERHLSESYADSASKTLLAENHHSTPVGYTGRRSLPNQ